MTPIELARALRDAPRYRSTAVLEAHQVSEPATWRSVHGDELRARAGDWELSDGRGRHWTVEDAIFRATYEQLPDGRYSKHATVQAIRVATAVDIDTLEGSAHAEPGDWVLRGASGELWPTTDRFFQTNYELVDDGSAG